ncbi:MAG: hypothetical protein KIS80_06130 [Anaerolineales bacterium]|nr:hypothetical protein [Anaerolineales bacterium]
MSTRLAHWLELSFWQLAVRILGAVRPFSHIQQANSKAADNNTGWNIQAMAGATLLLSFCAGALLGWFW